jgi:hypothetical protein
MGLDWEAVIMIIDDWAKVAYADWITSFFDRHFVRNLYT